MLRSLKLLAVIYHGPYFRRKYMWKDQRLEPGVDETEVPIQQRINKERRTAFDTATVRQTEPPHWSVTKKPTHFLSLRIPPHSAFFKLMKQFHSDVKREDDSLLRFFVPIERLHVSLGVFTVEEGQEQGNQLEAVSKLLKLVVEEEKLCFRLVLRGIGTFSKGRVVFCRVAAERDFSRLDALVQRLRYSISQMGIDIKGNPYDNYVPHVTIAKVRSREMQEPRVHHVPKELWASMKHRDFGEHVLPTIDLCSMKGRRDDGYYNTISTVELQ